MRNNFLFAQGANNTDSQPINILNYDRYSDGGPFAFSKNLPFSMNKQGTNLLSRYFDQKIIDNLAEYKEVLLQVAELISNTSLEQSTFITKELDHEGIYLKLEQNQASESFKDRGTLTALMFLLLAGNFEPLTMGTVSLGNMGISTPFMVDLLTKSGIKQLNSFVVISSNIQEVRRQAILRAASNSPTTVFSVEGEYADFHDQTYLACRQLRNNGRNVHAQLTDDILRISGYCSIFLEILEQALAQGFTPDHIVIPSCSGALYRAADYALRLAVDWGIITANQIPALIMVQETGADPINQAYERHAPATSRIIIQGQPVAAAISASNARSGTACLPILNRSQNHCISVGSQAILTDQRQLADHGLKYETGSTASITAIRELIKNKTIKPKDKVVALLTGYDEPDRRLMSNSIHKQTKIIETSTKELKQAVVSQFSNQFNF